MKKLQFLALLLTVPALVASASSLNLQQAESFAIAHAPEIKQLQAQSRAAGANAIAAAALPDPQLSFAAMNIPTDSFSLRQENMTQLQIGLMQQFPKGHSLKLRSQQGKLKSKAEVVAAQAMQLQVLKTLRQNWLQLIYWQKAEQIYLHQLKLFKQLLATSSSQLANNMQQQNNIVRVQLELSQLHSQLLLARQKSAALRAKLGRWLQLQSTTKLILQIPNWPKLKLKALQADLAKNPLLKLSKLNSEVSQRGISLAEQQYKPGFKVGLMYGWRQNTPSEQKRADFVGAQVTFNLPLFTANLQDQQVKASTAKYVAAQASEQALQNKLNSELQADFTSWQYLLQENKLYQQKILPEAKLYAASSLIAYQNKQMDFITLIRAYVRDYNTQLMAFMSVIKQKQLRVNLLYLQGKTL